MSELHRRLAPVQASAATTLAPALRNILASFANGRLIPLFEKEGLTELVIARDFVQPSSQLVPPEWGLSLGDRVRLYQAIVSAM